MDFHHLPPAGLPAHRGSMAGLYAPLPTLRSRPRGGLRTDRGRRGLLLLHRSGLSPHTPCWSPGALPRVAACTLARSRIGYPLSEGFRHFVASMPAPVASGWSESPGGPRTHWKAPPCHGAPPLRSSPTAGNRYLCEAMGEASRIYEPEGQAPQPAFPAI